LLFPLLGEFDSPPLTTRCYFLLAYLLEECGQVSVSVAVSPAWRI